MAKLRDDVTMLRAGLGDLHAEIATIQGDIAGLRRTSGSRDGASDKGIGGPQDRGNDEGTGGSQKRGAKGGKGWMRYDDLSWPSEEAIDSFFAYDTEGVEGVREEVADGVPAEVEKVLEEVAEDKTEEVADGYLRR